MSGNATFIEGDAGALDPPPRVAVVVSRYNGWITDALREGALAEHRRLLGETATPPTVLVAPGAFELPALAGEAARAGYEGVVCLGCVIKGETDHDVYINRAVSASLAALSAESGVPVGFGLLTVADREQAEARAGGRLGNKGAEAMAAVLETVAVLRSMRGSEA